jgi:Flp pilus assembly protein TadD
VDKEFLEARLVLGDLLTAKEQASAALPHYREAVRIDPESGRARLGLGTALALTGDQRGAVEQLRKAATAADAQVRESAAALLQELGVR